MPFLIFDLEIYDLQLKSSKKTLYCSLSLCSSSTTNNRSPVKLFAATPAVHTSTVAEEINHLIMWSLCNCEIEVNLTTRRVANS